ncbi:MAG: hypothetical protein IT368_13190 [Candidatus Hydrogenedentes bacterium]|nr:hypothetical protein [Candidatus Hydrogenedentota bacterium]
MTRHQKQRPGRTWAAPVVLFILLPACLAAAWLLWPRPVHAPAVDPLPEAPLTVSSGGLSEEAPASRGALRKVTLTPEEDLRGPVLAYVEDPEELHEVQLQTIAALAPEAESAGLIRSFANAVMMAGETWTVVPERITYLRLQAGAPQAFAGIDNPHTLLDTDASSVPLRPYEEEAIGLLRKGRGVVWKFEDYGLHAVGPLRNTGQCLRCHEQPENTLLGAMSYVYEELADD